MLAVRYTVKNPETSCQKYFDIEVEKAILAWMKPRFVQCQFAICACHIKSVENWY